MAKSVIVLLSALLFMSLTYATTFPSYSVVDTAQTGPVLDVTFNNKKSSTNLWTEDTLFALTDIVSKLQTATDIKVVVFRSAVPKYFLNHLDLQALAEFDITTPSRINTMLYNMTNLQQITIGAIDGRARGVGNQFVAVLDMRFATKAQTLLGQPEVGLGLVPGDGGTQYIARLMGRGQAMEYLLSSKDVNAQDAEKLGLINKAFDTKGEMNAHIEDLTSRMSLFPLSALGATKQSINQATKAPLEALLNDGRAFLASYSNPIVPINIAKALNATENQSDGDVERYLGDLLPSIVG